MIYSQTYSGIAPVSTSFTAADKATLVSGIISALTSAGWTDEGSGVLRSASSHPSGLSPIKVKIWDPGGANVCTRLMIYSPYDLTGSSFWPLLPNNEVYRVMANAYGFVIFHESGMGNRSSVYLFQPYIPPEVQGSPEAYSNCVIMGGAGTLNSDTYSGFGQEFAGNYVVSIGTIIINSVYYSSGQSGAYYMSHPLSTIYGDTAIWAGGGTATFIPLLGAHDLTVSRLYGWIMDAFVARDSATRGTLWNYDGHVWRAYGNPTTYSTLFFLDS